MYIHIHLSIQASFLGLCECFARWYLICELEDDDFPAHPGELVTIRSLRKAFSKDRMTKQNAEYLIERASRHAKAQAPWLSEPFFICLTLRGQET